MNINKYLFLFFIVLSTSFSCYEGSEEEWADCDYSNCNTTEPFEGILFIKLTINSENPSVPITIYKGILDEFPDNSNIIWSDISDSNEYSIYLPIDEYYSVTAEYKVGENTIIAVDGDKIKKKSSVVCDSTCWEVVDGSADVRLK